MQTRLLVLGAIVIAAGARPADAQTPCQSLSSLKLPRTTLTATLVPAGPYTGPSGFPGAPATAPVTLPAHCDVRGISRPSSDSDIRFAVWLPVEGWNGKYRQEGNGGWAGTIPLQAMIDPLRRGYAVAGTDDGHQGGFDAAWAVGHPEKLVDFGHRAVHETSEQAKAVVRAFYGRDATRSYFVGCSDGGREALMEAQRYADDFDGIIAGAPANNWSRLMTGFVWNEQALLNNPASSISQAKLAVIQKAALASCDALDGVKDGLVENPRVCRFDPGVLACKGGDGADCLTAPQVDAVRKIYAGPRNSRTGEQIFPGYPPGTEAGPGGWGAWIAPAAAANGIQFIFGNSYYGQAVFENPKWDFRTLNFDGDVAFAEAKLGAVLNSTSPDLRSFRARGGKIIQYHGWGDAAIAPVSSIDYYESVRSFLARFPDARGDASRSVEDFYRLFMVPGMGHCAGGVGPNSFGNGPVTPGAGPERDMFAALERWVEAGVAPDRLIGSGTVPGDAARPMTRPLCPHPQVATYRGSGDSNDAASFACAVPTNPR